MPFDPDRLLGFPIRGVVPIRYVGFVRYPNPTTSRRRHLFVAVCAYCGHELEGVVSASGLSSGNDSSAMRCDVCRPREWWSLKGACMSARWWGHFLDQAHRGDKVVEIEPEIALAQFDKQDWRCAKTGWPIFISLEYDGKRSNLEWNTRSRAGTASLDRIDNNDRRYRDGNIQWVHKLINQMRGHMTERLFHAVCNAVAARFPAENLDVGRQLEREIHDYIKGFDGVIEK